MPTPEDFVHIKPLEGDVQCEVHDWPTQDLPRRLVNAMRRAHPKGVNCCRECVERAAEEATAEKEAKCVLCRRGAGRGVGGRGHGISIELGMLDVSCPISSAELDKLIIDLQDAARDMFADKESLQRRHELAILGNLPMAPPPAGPLGKAAETIGVLVERGWAEMKDDGMAHRTPEGTQALKDARDELDRRTADNAGRQEKP